MKQTRSSSVGRASSLERKKPFEGLIAGESDGAPSYSHLEGRGFESLPPRPFKQFGLRFNEPVGLPECPYMVRSVLTVFGYSIRLHHWLASDDQRNAHDHPWDYFVVVLWGGKFEILPSTESNLDVAEWNGTGSVKFYRAEHLHTVKITKPCWTLLLTGRQRRDWGFYIPGRKAMMRPLRYFSRFGNPPCDDSHEAGTK